MRRNAISVGSVMLLLAVVAWSGQTSFSDDATGRSVANGAPAATVDEAVKQAARPKRKIVVPTARKKRRAPLVAAAVPLPLPAAPAPAAAKPADAGYHRAVDQTAITEKHKKIATAVLNALPAGCRDNLKNFSVLYTGATRRGLGGKTTIILDGSVPDAEFAALLVHECGHVINANLQGSATSGDSGYRDGTDVFYKDAPAVAYWSLSWSATGVKKPAMKDADFVSGYAKSDQYEDFAETFAAYVLQRDMLVAQAKASATVAAKLAWMETHLPLQDDALGDGSADWTGTVPWDITKLTYAYAL